MLTAAYSMFNRRHFLKHMAGLSLMALLALEAGAEELTNQEDEYVITTAPDQLYAVAEALRKAGVTTESQKFTFIPDTTITVADESVAQQVLRLCDALEDDDDVQNVYSNLEIPDEMLAKLPA